MGQGIEEMKNMDVVITYVNGNDPFWQAAYASATCQPALTKRYRDWGLLPFLFRGIEKHMPFVEHIYLVVSSASQVPEWVDTTKVRIVLHSDIIPQELLPTFNSTTIEIFLHRIEGLKERFIYFNDDFYPIATLCEEDFFQANKVVTHFSKHYLALNMYKKQVRQADRLARKAAQAKGKCGFVRPQHTCAPMLKSQNEAVMQKVGEEILPLLTRLRESKNPNQYVFTDYNYYMGRTIDKRIPTQHCSMAVYSPKQIAQKILHPKKKIICINDVELSPAKAQAMQTTLQATFRRVFPMKSKWEK